MFIKRCTRKKNGKPHTYWQLVESYRMPRGPRHRVVAYLGELDRSERRGWARLALQLDGKAAAKAQQLMLFDTVDNQDNDPVPQYVEVDLKAVRIERTRDFGDVFLALTLWRMLEFDEFFSKNLLNIDNNCQFGTIEDCAMIDYRGVLKGGGRDGSPWLVGTSLLARLLSPLGEKPVSQARFPVGLDPTVMQYARILGVARRAADVT